MVHIVSVNIIFIIICAFYLKFSDLNAKNRLRNFDPHPLPRKWNKFNYFLFWFMFLGCLATFGKVVCGSPCQKNMTRVSPLNHSRPFCEGLQSDVYTIKIDKKHYFWKLHPEVYMTEKPVALRCVLNLKRGCTPNCIFETKKLHSDV